MDNQVELGVGCIGTASIFCVEVQDKVARSDSTNSSVACDFVRNGVGELEILCSSLADLIIDSMHCP